MSASVPYVEREASIRRAIAEAPRFKRRRDEVVFIIEQAGVYGFTWKELSELMSLHHGQISAVLSTLHRDGLIVALSSIRNGSHPYVSITHSAFYPEAMLVRKPATTKAHRYRQLSDAVSDLLRLLDNSTCPCKSNDQIVAIEKVRDWLDE